jgi:cell division protein FtsI (penicillin-binding protein 3)
VTAKGANRRIRLLLLAVAIIFAALFGRAVWLQGIRSGALERLGASQNTVTYTLPAGRGAILDRQGVPLAMGTHATTVYADPLRLRSPYATAVAAGRALGLDADTLTRRLSDRTKRFVYIERQADPGGAAALERKHLAGVGFYSEERRDYPQNDIASHVIGYAGVDNVGLAGLERRYDRALSGTPGSQTVVRDPTGRAVDTVRDVPPREGRNIHLGLDRIVQENLQEVLAATQARWQARSATGIVLDPRNGHILAMASSPAFDANSFGATSPDVARNRAVTDTYEPGSTFKVVPVSAALSEGLVTPTNSFTLAPDIKVADRTIHDDDRTETRTMTVGDIVAYSSNVGAITLAELLGPRRLSKWIARFGFGRRTGIDFPGETRGIVVPLKDWSGSSIGNMPIGHGIGVTPVQMAAAYGAVANGGVWTQPHLVTRVDGRPGFRPKKRRIMSPTVANELLAMLQGVVQRGSGVEAAVAGYQVAGKTGTAAKPDARGYSHTKYVASFVGIIPASAPRAVILVAVDEPHGDIYGGTIAAPAFAQIAGFDMQYLGVPPDA